MKHHRFFRWFLSDDKPQQQEGSSGCLIFRGNDENLMRNGEILLEERVSLFDGRTNPIRCVSVDDLNSMNVKNYPIVENGFQKSYAGVWDDKLVLVKIHDNECSINANDHNKLACREIAVATQMCNHRNVHRLLGYCLETRYPVLVYEWPENGTLRDRIFSCEKDSKEALNWKDMLRIAWEIAHAVAYLHTAFKRPIIHRDLKPMNVYMDQDNSAKLSDFGFSISIPKGETRIVDVGVIGTLGYIPPEYLKSGNLAESADVYAFGILLLVLLTGKYPRKYPVLSKISDFNSPQLSDWVIDCREGSKLRDILDPSITTNEPADGPFERQLEKLVELALRCASREEERRPTMVDVAIELNNIIMLSSHPH